MRKHCRPLDSSQDPGTYSLSTWAFQGSIALSRRGTFSCGPMGGRARPWVLKNLTSSVLKSGFILFPKSGKDPCGGEIGNPGFEAYEALGYRRGRYTRDKRRIRCVEFPWTAAVKSLICLSAAGTSTFLRLARLILFRNRSLSESGAGGGSLPGPDGFCLRGKGTGTPLPPAWFPLWDLELRGRRLGPLKPG